jgi:hypothetical protein
MRFGATQSRGDSREALRIEGNAKDPRPSLQTLAREIGTSRNR